MILPLLAVLLAMAMVMTAGWVFQRAVNNAGWVDVFWTYGTGLILALESLMPAQGGGPLWRRGLVAGLLILWSLRLGTYVAVRVARGTEDARYAGMRREWGAKFQLNMLWLMLPQAPASAILAISPLLAARNPAPGLGAADILGTLILLAAILGEGVADEQLKRFKADPANKGKVCDAGLWGWSRHPNYFFEFLGWLAYPVIAFDPARPFTLAALIGPALMFVILRYGTGVPPLETAMLASRGDAYRAYQARVSPFLPRPPRKTP